MKWACKAFLNFLGVLLAPVLVFLLLLASTRHKNFWVLQFGPPCKDEPVAFAKWWEDLQRFWRGEPWQ